METELHGLADLFAQLGLPSDADAIRAFIVGHSPLPEAVRLEDAAFWTPAQASLIRDSLGADADWAEIVDRLNLALRRR